MNNIKSLGYHGFTGHRPDKLGGYGYAAQVKLVRFAEQVLKDKKPKGAIIGMALGWDMAAAQACHNLGIPYVAAVPFVGQEAIWQPFQKEQYYSLLKTAKEIVIVSEGGYAPKKMLIRNEFIVMNIIELIALWNGTNGGTALTIKLCSVPVCNVWNQWKIFS